ncbi:lipoprotein insertase outer membrane protein LolB [Cobetia amphilecti]|uniref:lipoprotein insertase outer membrane protein LolB n=1 Tax=Cobetia amphilecti TaxID=1055104 RepID=UPI003299708E
MITSPLPLPLLSQARRLLGPALLAMTLVLSGCASQMASDNAGDLTRSDGDWQQQDAQLAALTHWQLAGKVGIRTPEEGHSANLDWQQDGDDYHMLITGPLGAGRTTLVRDADGVRLSSSEGDFEAPDAESLMLAQLGWSLPLGALDNWVRGVPAAGEHDIETDELGFPTTLYQNGWEVDYQDWTRAEGLWLPRKMKLYYGDLTATLIVNQWQAL